MSLGWNQVAHISVQTEDFDIGAIVKALRADDPRIGAIATFIGLVRDFNIESGVESLTLEHYPEMTCKSLRAIVVQAQERWDLVDSAVVHRVGTLRPTDQIVAVAVASAHRGDAFAACEFIMDYLKTQAPFWKREETASGEHWVEARHSDTVAAERWED